MCLLPSAYFCFTFWFITGSRQGWKSENFSSVKRRDQKGRYTKTSIILSESFMHIYCPILQGPLFMLEKFPHENNWSKSTNFWFLYLITWREKYQNPGHGINARTDWLWDKETFQLSTSKISESWKTFGVNRVLNWIKARHNSLSCKTTLCDSVGCLFYFTHSMWDTVRVATLHIGKTWKVDSPCQIHFQ